MRAFVKKHREPTDVLFRIKRGLAGYVSYLAACQMNEAFSEYVLYEPILRILTARNYTVECEVECPGIDHAPTGDRKRIDFVVWKGDVHFALEVKWVNSATANVENDAKKLEAFLGANNSSYSFLCVFGRRTHLEHLRLKHETGSLTERGKAVYADMRRTKYGCRIYELDDWRD